MLTLLVLSACLTFGSSSVIPKEVSSACPPEGFNSVPDFNPDAYFNGSWYPVMQSYNSYQPADKLYCVVATYTMQENGKVDVNNRARSGSIDGEQSGGHLVGVIPDPSDPSKAKVGPSFIPELFYGDYWVVAIGKYADVIEGYEGESDNVYDWGVISGGLPNKETSPGKCLADGGWQNEGFWCFSRIPEPGQDVIDAIVKAAGDLLLDTSQLHKVVHSQDGRKCEY